MNNKFGNAKRDGELRSDMPSPTSYFKSTKHPLDIGKGNKNIRFGKNMRNANMMKDRKNPGPGQYEVNSLFAENLKKLKGTSFSGRFKNQSNYKNPGPGKYEDNLSVSDKVFVSTKKNTGKCIFGKNKRFGKNSKINNAKIGPGSYGGNFFKYQVKKKSIKFGKENRFKKKVKDVPGPGQYKMVSAFNDIPYYLKGTMNLRETI